MPAKRGNGLEKFHIEPVFSIHDVLQVIVGACILAVPVGFTEETWRLGETLPLQNVFGLMVLSFAFISVFTQYQYHKHAPREHRHIFFKRVIFTYIFAFIVVSLILTLIERAPWSTDMILAFKRTAIVTFPASLSGAIADTF